MSETRKYEAIIVLSQSEDSVDDMIATIGKEMEEEGVKLDKIDKLGKRTFAYNARKQASGYYVNYFFEGDPSVIKKIRSRLTLNTDIYLQQYQAAN